MLVTYLKRMCADSRRDCLGLALFLGWVYCALFGCGLSTSDPAFYGTPATYNLERLWMVSGIAEALGASAGLVAHRLLERSGREVPAPSGLGGVAAALAVLATVTTWLSWLDRTVWFYRLFWVAGLFAGLAIALFTIAWGRRLCSIDEAHIEFVVPCAFALSFAIYLVLLLLKHGSEASAAIMAVLCLGIAASAVCLLPPRTLRRAAPPDEPVRAHDCSQPLPRKDMLSLALLTCVSWVQIALFRILATPPLAGDRFMHYLYPFLLACAVSCVMLLLCIRISRHLNVTLAFRWSLPFFAISYVPLITGIDTPVLRMAAYALNFLGMFGVQYGCWMGVAKYVRRARCAGAPLFANLALGEGLGIALGCGIGLLSLDWEPTVTLAVSFGILSLVVLVSMTVGFSPTWTFSRTRQLRASAGPAEPGAPAVQTASPLPGGPDATEDDEAVLEQLFRRQALRLQATYLLTDRETEVCELLLAGRSRPFIRDELLISLNTVGVHVRSIFAKCDVHSQQELIGLARTSS